MEEDYYKLLGLNRNSSADEIQKAYRDLARKYHPDLNPNDKTAKSKFQAVQRAYEVLSDPQKREMYDRYGSSFESAGAGGPGGGPAGGTWHGRAGGAGTGPEDLDFGQFFGERFGQGAGGAFGDMFEQFRRGRAGSQRGRTRPSRGADLQHELTVPFATAISGGEARLKIQRKGGATETISVKIPPGIEEGKKIRLRGQGEKPARGAPGDILITVHVAPHPYFQRRGDDLHVKVPVTLAEAAEGAKVDVPTPGGTITLCVPPRTSSGRRLRVRGRGVPKRDGKAGDLYAEVQIVLPTSLDEQSLQWMRQISTQYGSNPRSELKW